MRVRVLGCSGAIARGCKTTSFLAGESLLVDAGTGAGDLTRDEMLRIDDVLLTHAHLDHIACLPLMVDTVAAARAGRPLRVHALPETLTALRQHIFNGVIWPDFSRLPSSDYPLLTFKPLAVGDVLTLDEHCIEVLPAQHAVPAVGYALRSAADDAAPWWVFSGDTERNPGFWARVNQMNVAALVIETAFSNRERELARLARHLSPEVLADELDQLDPTRRIPIYITHTKPAETETIMREIAALDQVRPGQREVAHDIRWLSASHVFHI
ncbi:3',5'-cyclic-nucleotide phosphodiesterase [Ottowia sp.]|uniref:3',5'-cyclic-nucleotide phosphodiesterase n=1 Tax=Ottowia sp. TaxID=1898956 RepID=UPI003A89DC86